MSGKLYLIPSFLSDTSTESMVPFDVKSVIKNTTYYAVENVRTARRFISALKLGIDISTLNFQVVDKNFKKDDCPELFQPIIRNKDLGVISEAGLPAIADPGSLLVQYAHKNKIPVIPLPGPSSIILGLISSGFNGQHFTFHGYLPIDKSKRTKTISDLEKAMNMTGYTQIFMETPYRNQSLLTELLRTLHPESHLYVGMDLTGKNESTTTMKVTQWRSSNRQLPKLPSIFAIGIPDN